MKDIRIFIALIDILLFLGINTLRCDEEEIENCLKCGTGENSNRCDQCEDNYFPFLFNYLCLPCDHMYGDSGCLGKCTIDIDYQNQCNICIPHHLYRLFYILRIFHFVNNIY